MKRTITIATLSLGLLALTAGNPAGAADKKAKEGEVNGRVQMIDKGTSAITVQKGTAQRKIIFNADTKWVYGTLADAKPSSADQLKEGWYIHCKGTFDGVNLVANACRFREKQ